MLLLLILFAGCLSSCAAQTTYFPFSTTGTTAMDFTPLSQSLNPMTVLPRPGSANIVAILQATVQSALELNEATFTSVLNQLHAIIRQLDPDVNFTLTLKNITRA